MLVVGGAGRVRQMCESRWWSRCRVGVVGEVREEGKHVRDEGSGLWVEGKAEDVLAVGGGGDDGGWRGWSCWATIEHYLSLGGEEGMGAVGTLLWAVSAVKAQNQTTQEGAPPNADPGGSADMCSLNDMSISISAARVVWHFAEHLRAFASIVFCSPCAAYR